jgi:hypothetical protein
MYEQCLYCRYTFHSHSRVCMNNVCIAVIHFTVTVGMYEHCSYIPYCDCEIYNSNTNTVHTYPTVTVKYITAIQTLFEQCLYCCYTFHSHRRVCMNNVCIAVIHFTVTVGYVWTVFVLLLYISQIQTLFIHTLLWLWNV